ncbi:MAG: hypothetical protein WC763_03385 [Candidatus Paceibacterota bacterium]|jgi:hypothetical protein
MKTSRTLTDLGVGHHESLGEKFLRLVSSVTELTAKQKILLAIPVGIVSAPLAFGMIRFILIVGFGKSAVPIMWLDWWWVWLR